MALSRSILKSFAKVTNDRAANTNVNTYVYATAVIGEDGSKYVKIDGSEQITPVSKLTDIEDGDRVMVTVQDHKATVMGNLTYPPSARNIQIAMDLGEANLLEIEQVRTEIIEANYARFEDIEATYARITEIDALHARIDTIEAGSITAEYINSTVAELGYVTATQIESEYVKTATLEADYATLANLEATKADITELFADYAKITELEVEVARINILEVETATIEQLNATKAEIDELLALKATIDQLKALEAEIDDLKTLRLKVASIEADYATIVMLEATNANIDVLESDVASINTLVNGNLTSDNIQSLTLNSSNVTIANGTIKSAMIESLAFDKITGFDINTTNLTIHSEDGKSKWSDNTIQISDANRVRVQIGKDASEDYSMSVWDASGNLIWDALGATENTIQRPIIRNDVVADDAAIAGSKLDIESVVSEINGATTKLKSTTILVDETNQTLDVSFKSLETTVANNLTEAKAYVDGEIDGLEIGGRNFIKDSDIEWTVVKDTTSKQIARLDVYNSSLLINKTITLSYYQHTPGTRSTALDSSSDIQNRCGMHMLAQWIDSTGVNSGVKTTYPFTNFLTSTTDNSRVQETIKLTPPAGYDTLTQLSLAVHITAIPGSGNDETWKLGHPKLELGTKATDWTPAPEDTQSQIDELTTVTQTHSTNISVIQGQIESLIAKDTEFDNTITSQYNSTVADIDSLRTTIGEHTTQLNSQNGQIESVTSRVTVVEQDLDSWSVSLTSTQSDLTALTSRVSTNETSITALQGEIALKVSQTEVDDAINGISIGGRNLALKTATAKSVTGTNSNNQIFVPYYLSKNWNTLIGESVTISFDYEFSEDSAMTNSTDTYVVAVGMTSSPWIRWVKIPIPSTGLTGHCSGTFVIPDTMTSALGIGVRLDYFSGTLTLSNFKMEKGNIATDWTPAPEDYSTTSQMESAINVSKESILSTVSETYTTITQRNADQQALETYKSEVALKLTKDSIVSTVGDYYATLEDINVGGRNLLKNTKKFTPIDKGNSVLIDETYRGFSVRHLDATSLDSSSTSEFAEWSNVVYPSYGDVYTLSFYAKGTGGLRTYFYGNTNYVRVIIANTSWGYSTTGYADGNCPCSVTSDWKRYWITYKCADTGDTTVGKYILFRLYGGNDIYVCGVKLEKGNIATDWTPAPEDDLEYISSVETIATQTRDKFNWIVKSGTSASDFTITDRMASLTAEYINLNGLVTFSGLGSDAQTAITNAQSTADSATTKANNAQSTANTANSTANAVTTTVNNNKANWDSAYSWTSWNGNNMTNLEAMVKKWTNGAVSTTTTIQGGWITTNTITADKIAIGDFTNYAQLNEYTLSKWGWTSVADSSASGNPWFQRNNIARDNAISEYHTCNGGEVLRVKADIFTSVYGASSSGGTDSSARGVTIMIFAKNAAGTTSYIGGSRITAASTSGTTGSLNFTITLPTTARKFAVYVQIEGWPTFTGTLRVRNVKVTNMTTGELIVNGCITADKIAAGTITATQIASGTITASNIATGTITADKINITDLFAQNITATGTITGAKLVGSTVTSSNTDGSMYTTLGNGYLIAKWEGSSTYTLILDASCVRINKSDSSWWTQMSPSTFTVQNGATVNDSYAMMQGSLSSTWVGAGTYAPFYAKTNWTGLIPLTTLRVNNYGAWVHAHYTNDSKYYLYYLSETTINNSTNYYDTAFKFGTDGTLQVPGAIYEGGTALTSKYAAASHTHNTMNYTTVSALGWSGSNGTYYVTSNALAYWNGAYSGSGSNLAYCNKGAFGSIVTKGSGDYLAISGGTLTGNLTVSVSSATARMYTLTNSAGTIDFRIASDGNAGIYSTTKSSWLIWHRFSDNSCQLPLTTYVNYLRSYSGTVGIDMNQAAFKPSTNNAYQLGSSNYKWTYVYATNGTIQTSDENEKDIISGVTESYENMFMDLNPILYRWRDLGDGAQHDRIHCGLGAQSVIASAQKYGLDSKTFAAICYDELDEPTIDGRSIVYGLNYGELHGLEIHMIQKNYRNITELQNGMTTTQSDVEQLKQQYLSQEERMQYVIQQLQQAQAEIGQLQTQLKALA